MTSKSPIGDLLGNSDAGKVFEKAKELASTVGAVSKEVTDVLEGLPFLKPVFSLIGTIIQKAVEAQRNKQQCARLSLRVAIVRDSIVGLDRSTLKGRRAAVEQLQRTLEECAALVTKLAARGKLMAWAKSGSDSDRLNELTVQLGEDMQHLQLSVTAEHFVLDQRDAAATEEALKELGDLVRADGNKTREALKEIHAVASEAHSDLLAQRAMLETQNALLARSLAQMQEQQERTLALLRQLTSAKSIKAQQHVLTDRRGQEARGQSEALQIDAADVVFDASLVVRSTSGAFVFAGTWCGEPVSVKAVSSETSVNGKAAELLRRELVLMERLRHPRLVATYGAVIHEFGLLLLQEPIERGSLDRVAAGALDEWTQLRLCCDVAHGLACAHSRGILHRALKAAACVVTHDFRAKLADFAFAKSADLVTIGTGALRSATDEWRWLAPEIVSTAASDVFSLGVVLVEVVTGGAQPWSGVAHGGERRVPAPGTEKADPDLKGLMSRCLAVAPTARPTASEVGAALGELHKRRTSAETLVEEAKKITSTDHNRAVAMLKEAAKSGSVKANDVLGDIFAGVRQSGIEKSKSIAIEFYDLAAARGDAHAAHNAAELRKQSGRRDKE